MLVRALTASGGGGDTSVDVVVDGTSGSSYSLPADGHKKYIATCLFYSGSSTFSPYGRPPMNMVNCTYSNLSTQAQGDGKGRIDQYLIEKTDASQVATFSTNGSWITPTIIGV